MHQVTAEGLENPIIRLFCTGKLIKGAIPRPPLEREAQVPSCPQAGSKAHQAPWDWCSPPHNAPIQHSSRQLTLPLTVLPGKQFINLFFSPACSCLWTKRKQQLTLRIGKGFSSVRHLSASNWPGAPAKCSGKCGCICSLHMWEGEMQQCRGPATARRASCTTPPHAFLLCLRLLHTDEGQFVTHPPTLTRNKVIKPDLSADRKPADIFNSAY